MRELHGWHGDHGRHARDAAPDAPVTRAHDAPKYEVLRDPEVRKAEFFKYQKIVEATQAKYAAEQLKTKEAQPERAPPETRDKPASRIADRTKPLGGQREDRREPERSWLPANDTTQMVAGIGVALSSLADAFNVLPGRWDAVATSLLGAAVAGVAWGNRRWKDRHGSRPED